MPAGRKGRQEDQPGLHETSFKKKTNKQTNKQRVRPKHLCASLVLQSLLHPVSRGVVALGLVPGQDPFTYSGKRREGSPPNPL